MSRFDMVDSFRRLLSQTACRTVPPRGGWVALAANHHGAIRHVSASPAVRQCRIIDGLAVDRFIADDIFATDANAEEADRTYAMIHKRRK
jgi:hypothetical protein